PPLLRPGWKSRQESSTPGSRDRALRRYRYSQRGYDSMTRTRSFSSRIAIGAPRRLFSTEISSECLGIVSVRVKSPVDLGFQTTASLVRLMAAIRTSFETSSPSEVLSVTVVRYSRGSELSTVNGTRTDLPATPKVGRSRLNSSTSGSRVRLPTGT